MLKISLNKEVIFIRDIFRFIFVIVLLAASVIGLVQNCSMTELQMVLTNLFEAAKAVLSMFEQLFYFCVNNIWFVGLIWLAQKVKK